MIRLANAPVSWGVDEFARASFKPWNEVLDEIARAGYAGTELGPYGYLPTDTARLKQELARRGLALISAFIPLTAWDQESLASEIGGIQATAQLLRACGAGWIVLSLTATAERIAKVGRAAAEDGWDTATWQQVGQTLNQVARDVRSQFGLKAVFHHHMGTYVETPQEVDALLANTGADLIGLCLDTGHYAFGGGDPVELVARAGERIPYLHFKDIDPQVLQRVKAEKLNYHQAVAADIYCRLGQGCARLPELIGRLKMQHYDGWAVVEQDVIAGRGSDPFGSAVRSREAVEGWLAAP